MVGAVVVNNDVVVGEGYHTRYGAPHAEIEALGAAGERARGATVYVSLEPCNHHGKTPPCAEALVKAGVVRVVAAMRDPNSRSKRGGDALLAAGIPFESGLMEDEARELNIGFVSRVTRGRPRFLHLYELDTDDAEDAFQRMTPATLARLATREERRAWMGHPELVIDYVSTFRFAAGSS